MNVMLTPYWDRFVQEHIESGDYADVSAVVHEALRMLQYKERVLAFRAYAKEALDPANADKLIDAGPGFAEERMQRILAGERRPGPTPWYLLPPQDETADPGTWFPEEDEFDDEPELRRRIAESGAPHDSDAAR